MILSLFLWGNYTKNIEDFVVDIFEEMKDLKMKEKKVDNKNLVQN
jgi:hypothetical protein